jgi:uncharacterized protein YycO
MRKVLLAAALTLVPALFSTGKAVAQTNAQYGTEVCVNASGVAEAKRLFPNARIHVVPDSTDPDMNGWRIVSGPIDASGRIHSDAQERELRRTERGLKGFSE